MKRGDVGTPLSLSLVRVCVCVFPRVRERERERKERENILGSCFREWVINVTCKEELIERHIRSLTLARSLLTHKVSSDVQTGADRPNTTGTKQHLFFGCIPCRPRHGPHVDVQPAGPAAPTLCQSPPAAHALMPRHLRDAHALTRARRAATSLSLSLSL